MRNLSRRLTSGAGLQLRYRAPGQVLDLAARARPRRTRRAGQAGHSSAPDAKGLEFDAVVVVEPASIAGDTARGLRLLYVALTRPIQHLSIVHALPLPDALVATT